MVDNSPDSRECLSGMQAKTKPVSPERRSATSEESEHNRAIDDESTGAVLSSTRSGDGAGLYQGQHLEFFDHSRTPAAVDRLLRPFTDIDVPQRTVVCGDRGNSAQHIERTATIGEGAEQA